MSNNSYPVNTHHSYHAHLYFDESTFEVALEILAKIENNFSLKVGRKHKKLVGPHPMWSCQILFGSNSFSTLIPWLDENRRGLSVLVHPVTQDDLYDHTELAAWLGDKKVLNLALFY
ncbi:MAG: DOPA 4,5-dioxygenase family protein [Oceanospirillaceae bacterium]